MSLNILQISIYFPALTQMSNIFSLFLEDRAHIFFTVVFLNPLDCFNMNSVGYVCLPAMSNN